MKFLGRLQPLGHYRAIEALAVIKELGFDGAEISFKQPDLTPHLLSEELALRITETVEELKLEPHSVSYHTDYIYNDEEFECSKKAIEYTHLFGTDICIFSNTLKGKENSALDKGEWELLIQRTKELVERAEDYGVRLAQEFEPGFIIGSTEDLHRLFNEIPSDNLKVNMDLGHSFLCDPDPVESIKSVGDKIIHCHVENMAAGVHKHLLPQEGDMDLSEYGKVLKEIGFEGGLALDLYGVDYEAVAPEALEFLRKTM